MSVPPAQLNALADKVGQLKDRQDRLQLDALAQKAPLLAAQKVIDASMQALTAATTGLQALLAKHQAASKKPKANRKR